MKRIFIVLCVTSLISCQDKVICSAYQSTYILDDSTRNAYFSYVWQLDEGTRAQFLAQNQSSDSGEDTLGVVSAARPQTDYYAYAGEKVVPWRIPAQSKYGIIKPVFTPLKKYRMRTAPMENVFAPDPPASNDYVAGSALDSTRTDSLSLAATDTLSLESFAMEEEKPTTRFLYGYDPADNFNVEQQYYNKYFSDRLIDHRPEPEPQPIAVDSTGSDSTVTKEPFFKGLFKKNNKEQPGDTLTTQEDPFIEETVEEGEND